MVNLWLVFALLLIAADWTALWKERPSINYLTKPFALLFLLIWFWSSAGVGWMSTRFMLGFFFSLAGDGFLLLSSQKYFRFGLVAFLLAHLSYLLGFGGGLDLSVWQLWASAAVVSIAGGVSIQPLLRAVRRSKTHRKMLIPILLYALVINGVLVLAFSAFFRPDWTMDSAALAVSGALLFLFSDLYLAYDRFVLPKKHARLMVRITYHLGQLALAAGVILHTTGG